VALGAEFRIPKAAEVVARDLRNRIIRGDLKEGESLPSEGDLTESFGVSRPTLREAVRILESENLIRVARGARGGARVLRPDPEVASRHFGVLLQARGVTIGDIYRTRRIIEPPAARIATETGGAAAIERLEELIEHARKVLDDDRQTRESSARFFQTLVALSGVQTLMLLSSMLEHLTARYNEHLLATASARSDYPARKRRALKVKERLVALMREGDGAAAEAFLAGYMAHIAELLERWGIADQVLDVLSHPPQN
jgi:DNA-binding FadR family transcriptional regulator